MYKKIGKSADFILEYQPHLLDGIDSHIADQENFESSYRESPVRPTCVVCEAALGDADFLRNSIQYIFCRICGHLNGNHQVSEDLADLTYDSQTEQSMKYDKLYIMPKEKFLNTVAKIYLPKAEFLQSSLVEIENLLDLRILDFGTGSGHMVKALGDLGFNNVIGIDPMKTTIEYGKKVIGIEGLSRIRIQDSLDFLRHTNAELITMLCTLPHVTNHHEILSAMVTNPNIRYTFQKLPMFSLGSMLDVTSPTTNSRVLAGAHNHVYTDSSLEFIEKRYGLKRISEWRFGSDIVDLYRNILIKLNRIEGSENAKTKFSEKFLPMIDDLQRVVDSNNFASEIHILWEVPRS
jgi:SAM-dependent methyltransferase